MEMIERVAKAMVAKVNQIDGEGRGWEEASADERAEACAIARAAIEAMREPTNEMEEAAYADAYGRYDYSIFTYEVMIDAALATTTPTSPSK
jgi:hypothetical protein